MLRNESGPCYTSASRGDLSCVRHVQRGFAAAIWAGVPAVLPSPLCSGFWEEEAAHGGDMPGVAKSTLVLEGLRVAKEEQAVTYPRRLTKLPACKVPGSFIPCQLFLPGASVR